MAGGTEKLLRLVIDARNNASPQIAQVNSSLGSLASQGVKALLPFAAGALTIGTFVKGLSDCTQAAMQEQAGIAKLGAAVKATGADWTVASTQIEKYLTSALKRTALDDGAGRAAIQGLTQVTQDYNKALALMPLAQDLATAKGIDLASAATLVGRAAEGNVTMLQRYGIVLDGIEKGSSSAAKGQAALAELQTRFGGQAAAYAETAAGAQDQLNIALGNLKETVGTELLPIITDFAKGLATLATNVLPSVATEVKLVVRDLENFAAPIIKVFELLDKARQKSTQSDAALAKSLQGQAASGTLIGQLATEIAGPISAASKGLESLIGPAQGSETALQGIGRALVSATLGTTGAMQLTTALQGLVGVLPSVVTGVGGGFQTLGTDLSVLSATGIQAVTSYTQSMLSLAAIDPLAAIVPQVQVSAAQINEALGAAFSSDKVQAALAGIQGVIAQHTQTMDALETQALTQGLDKIQQHYQEKGIAEQRYQGERAALLAAGRTQDAADLAVKFQNEQVQSENAYAMQGQEQEKALVTQQIQAQVAYIALLQTQHDAAIKALEIELKKWAGTDEVKIAAADSAIAIAYKSGSDQLIAEKKAADLSLDLAKQLAEGKITAAEASAAALAASTKEQSIAEGELKALRDKLHAITITMPPLDFTSFVPPAAVKAAGAQAQQAAEKASEPVTKTLAEVTSQIDAGIKGAKSAIEQLLTFDMPTEAVAGLKRYGEFIALAVSGIYTALKPEMDHLSALKEPIVTAKAVLDLLTGSKGLMEPVVEGEKKLPDIVSWVGRIRTGVQLMGQAVLAIDKALGKDELAKAATAAASVKAISDLFTVNLSGMNAPKADFATQFDRYFEGLQYGATRLSQWMLAIPAKYKALLPQAAAASASIKTIMDLGVIDLSKFSPIKGGLTQFEANMKGWYAQAEYAARGMVAWMGRIPEAWQKLLPAAQASAQAIKGIMDLGMIDLSKMIPAKGGFEEFTRNLKGYYAQFEYAARGFAAWMTRIPDKWRLEYLPAAQTAAQQIKGILELGMIDLSKMQPATMEVGGKSMRMSMETFVEGFKLYFQELEYAARTLAGWMRDIPTNWKEKLLPEASKAAEEIKKILDLLSLKEVLGEFGKPLDYNTTVQAIASFIDGLRASVDLMVPALEGIRLRYGDALERVAATATTIGQITGLLPGIASSIWDAWDEGGIPIEELRSLLAQLRDASLLVAGMGIGAGRQLTAEDITGANPRTVATPIGGGTPAVGQAAPSMIQLLIQNLIIEIPGLGEFVRQDVSARITVAEGQAVNLRLLADAKGA